MRRVDFASSSGYKVNACLLPLLIWNKVVRNVIPKIHYLIFFSNHFVGLFLFLFPFVFFLVFFLERSGRERFTPSSFALSKNFYVQELSFVMVSDGRTFHSL